MIGLSEIEQVGVCIETEDPEPVIARMLAVSHHRQGCGLSPKSWRGGDVSLGCGRIQCIIIMSNVPRCDNCKK